MLDVKSIMEDSTEIIMHDGKYDFVGSGGRSSEETAEEEEDEAHKQKKS